MNKKITQKFIEKMRPSGLLMGIAIGAAAAFAIQKIDFSNKLAASLLPGGGVTVCGLSSMPATSNLYGIIGSEQEFNSAVASYQQAHPSTNPNATWGGMIGRNHLIAIINSLGPDATEVNYKFITSGNGKTSIFFQGGTFNEIGRAHV